MPQAIPALISLALHAVHGIAWVNQLAQMMTLATVLQGIDAVVKNNSKVKDQGGLINLELNPAPPRRLIIGKRAVGGTLVDWYLGSTNNTKLYLPVYLSEGPCGTITKVWAGGRVVWSTPLVHGVRTAIPDFRSGGDRVWLTYYDGRVGQTADPSLVTYSAGDWTSANKMTGCAYVVVELQWDSDNLRSPPQFVFEHEGAKFYDRRKDSTAGGSGLHRLNDPTTWELGDAEGVNPMVALDHFQLGRFWNGQRVFGIGMPSKFVPYDKFLAQANVCDENVALKAGGTQKRYRANGIITANEAWDDVIKRHCTAMCAQPADFGGRVGVIGIEARTPVMELHDDDLPDMASETYTPKRTFGNLVGVVRGKYQEPAQVYQPIPYAEVSDPVWNTQDGAEPREFTFDLDFETNSERAERLATLKARYERRQGTLTGIYPYHTIELERGDWFVRTGEAGSRFGVTGKTFEVMERVFDPVTFTVTINAQEVDPSDSAWSQSLAADPPPVPISGTATLSAVQVPAITVTAISLTGTLSSVPALRIAWTAPTDPRVRFLYVEVENTDGTTPKTAKTIALPSDANFIVVSEGVADGEEYGVSAKFLSDTLQSEWCIAAIVFSSGAFATGAASSVPWSGVTGAGKPADNATVGGTFGIDVRETSGGVLATLAAFKTALGQAATIVGQGNFATVSTVANGSAFLTGFGGLSSLGFTTFGTNVRRADGTTIVTDALAITSLGQAASFVGQAALASLAFTTFGTNVRRADGTTIVTDALAITSLGQAATIVGQGNFATQSSVAYGSAFLTGFGSLAPLGFTTFGTNVRRADGTTIVTDALAITSLGQAATIVGQGNFATQSSVAYGSAFLTGFGSLAPLGFTTFGTNVRRADGTTIVTDALAITSLGQAATIAGQGDLATQSLVSSALLAAGVGKNAMYDTRFALDFANNFRGLAASGTPTFTTATSAAGVEYLQVTGAGVTIGNTISIDDYPRRTLFPVKAGERVEAHGLIGGANCSAFFARITWRDAASVFLSVSTGSSVASPGAGGGDVSTYTKVGVIATAPANAVYAQVEFMGTASTAAPQIRVSRPFKTLAKAGQTEFSEWGPGIEAEVGADVTIANQAASFTGQAALATLAFTTFGTNVRRADGTTIVTDALAITSLGQAATIAGQGNFATQSSVAYGSAFLTGFGSLAPLGFTTFGTNVRRADGTTVVTDALAITSLGQAATIAGQGNFATQNSVAYGSAFLTGFGSLAPLGFTTFGTNVRRADGTTVVTDALAITSLGQAATIAGQGNFATQSSVAYGSAFLTGFGSLAPLGFTTFGTNVRRADGTTVVTDALAITSLGQAASITGQGDLALTNRATLPFGSNAAPNSEFLSTDVYPPLGWSGGGTGNTTGVTFAGSLVTGGQRRAIKAVLTGTVGAGSTYSDTAYTGGHSSGILANTKRYALPVVAGDTVAASALVTKNASSSAVFVNVVWVTDSGAYISEVAGNGVTQSVSGDSGNPADYALSSLVAVAPANARFAIMYVRQSPIVGQVNPTAWFMSPLISRIQTGQTAVPPYTPGEVDRRANATAENQAATIAGQGAFATVSSVANGSAFLTGFGSLSSLAFTSFGTNVRRADGTTIVTDALAITSLGQAATIVGQGNFATQSSVAYGSAFLTGFGSLAPLGFTSFGNNVRRADGATVVTDAAAITSLGQAATIAGQGSFATLSSVARTSGLLTDFGSLAGLSNVLGLQAGSITGQGWGATASEANASNAQIPLGENLLVNTDWQEGIDGWAQGWTGDSGLGVTQGMALSGWTGFVRTSYVTIAGTPAINTVADSLTQKTYANLADLRRYSPRVRVGDRLWAGSYAAGHRCRCVVIVCWFDENGAIISSIEVGRTTSDNTPGGFANGRLENAERIGSFITVPASTCYMQIIHRLVSVGGVADPYAFFGFPMVAKVSSMQTVAPAYVTGKADRYVDYTPENQAASFSGQAALATLSFVQLSSNVRLADGTTIATNALLVTSQGQAATIAGQGALATKSQVGTGDFNVASLSAITATIGTLRTAISGPRVEIKDNIIEVYDANRLRVQLGIWT